LFPTQFLSLLEPEAPGALGQLEAAALETTAQMEALPLLAKFLMDMEEDLGKTVVRLAPGAAY
jgi:hypothetical protein